MLDFSSNFHLSLKSQLLVSVSLIMLVGFLIGGSVILHNAHQAVEAEIESTFALSKQLIESLNAEQTTKANKLDLLPDSIKASRHLEILRQENYVAPVEVQSIHINNVPNWFVKLVYPRKTLKTNRVIRDQHSNNLILIADPADEIQEIWEDVRDLLVLAMTLFISSLILIYFSIWRGLRPLKVLQHGFKALESNQLDIEITEKTVPELKQLHKSFNQMVKTLRKTTQDKQNLSRKLVSLQESERSNIARELHDEVGPYLFSLRVTNSNLNKTYQNDRNNEEKVISYIEKIDHTTEQLQLQIKQLLKKLRPMILNDLSLNDAILDLLDIFKTSDPSINWELEYTMDIETSDAINVTLYRIIQECLTNIGKHSNATKALVSLSTVPVLKDGVITKHNIVLTVEDDGQGISGKASQSSYGLIGIQERVEALGGCYEQLPKFKEADTGVAIVITIPIHS